MVISRPPVGTMLAQGYRPLSVRGLTLVIPGGLRRDKKLARGADSAPLRSRKLMDGFWSGKRHWIALNVNYILDIFNIKNEKKQTPETLKKQKFSDLAVFKEWALAQYLGKLEQNGKSSW